LRFLYVKTLKRPYPLEEVPYPKRPSKLPVVLSQEEVVALITDGPAVAGLTPDQKRWLGLPWGCR
jgi:site-specific recombinase XerD